MGGTTGSFQPTLWTIVLRAKDPGSPDRRQALESLIQTYWRPVYVFVRRRGNDVETAKDLTQSFFQAFLEKDFLKNVSPEKGKFRSFLQASLTYFLSDQFDRTSARKRGGGYAFVRAEDDLQSAELSPEQAFFRQWAQETMTEAVARLRRECRPEEFALLTGNGPPEMAPAEKKRRAFRLRSRLRELLRDVIRPSVESEADV